MRFRGQLRITALLFTALVAVLLFRFGRERWKDFQEYRKISKEISELKSETARMKKVTSSSSKEKKEMAKVLDAGVNGREVVSDLAAISKLLPDDVMLSDFRWNENEISLTIQSEKENLDLSVLFAPLRRWKVSDVQHRNSRMSAITVINAKLIPAHTAKNGKGSKGAGKRKK